MPRRRSKPQPPVAALDAGLRLLARRAHSRVELRRKLSRRGYEEEDIRAALSRLAELGYVDDASFADGHIRRRSASLGPMALSAELAARGVDKHTAGAALRAFDRDAQLAAATRLAERLCGRNRPAGYGELLDTIGVKLLRRGFPQAVARDACRVVWARAAGTPNP
ncbi:MAG TPA: regulatory protein RecX [Candidatus Dormibacteraeota bacterium]|nr:regulatory protein RecX [Candidatus Dormibacteraeota bacterium]